MIQQLVSNKAKGKISKRVLQANKAHQIFRKTTISYPLIRTRMCAYKGVRIIADDLLDITTSKKDSSVTRLQLFTFFREL